MKRIFIIFVMLVAIGSTYEGKAQKKVFLNEYNRLLQLQTNPTYARTIELTHFTGEMLQMMVKSNDSKTQNLIKRINSIYQIKIIDNTLAVGGGVIRTLKRVTREGKYDIAGIFTTNGVKYEIYRTAFRDLNEYLIFITSGKQTLVCDIYGDVVYKEILAMIFPSQPKIENMDIIDTLKTQ